MIGPMHNRAGGCCAVHCGPHSHFTQRRVSTEFTVTLNSAGDGCRASAVGIFLLVLLLLMLGGAGSVATLRGYLLRTGLTLSGKCGWLFKNVYEIEHGPPSPEENAEFGGMSNEDRQLLNAGKRNVAQTGARTLRTWCGTARAVGLWGQNLREAHDSWCLDG